LTKFRNNTSRYSKLIAVTTSIDENLSTDDVKDLWSLVDYGLMSEVAVPAIVYTQVPVTEWSSTTWLDSGDGSEMHTFGNSTMTAENFGGQNYAEEEYGLLGSAFL
jgi:hypothetical protein